MTAAYAVAKSWMATKTPLLCALAATLFGVGAEVSGAITDNGNRVFWVAMCALAGAFAGSLPRILGAIFGYRQSEREFVGKEIHGLIRSLKKNNSDNEQILALQQSVRHTIQGGYQAAIWHISLLERELKQANITDIPKLSVVDVSTLLINMDKEILKLKSAKPHDEMVSI